MTGKIMLAVAIGVGLGLLLPSEISSASTMLLNIGLCVLLFFVGIDIGRNKTILQTIKRSGIFFIMVPLGTAVGSIGGAMIAGLFLGYPVNEAGAVGAGFGWYTLSAIIIAPYQAELSVLAFLTNIMREIIAILTIPILAKRLGHIAAIAPSGATAMDTTLPIISKHTSGETAVLAFATGLILSLMVPVLVPFILKL
ncbi:lysine exporter LysO family protein [Fusibacter paucivorans]|uniref:Lysine exporter LysO family protein n=1 Tax=Fusibacter paucivorans TaxID=76009 RepID=A0ABS5PUH4_9FIRM|nr:lysine exporter LysO family protein [Fusibacter paucivorans]MBS7528049.1 lysine exporter LysO family protein [Fusibacter paucivorans]